MELTVAEFGAINVMFNSAADTAISASHGKNVESMSVDV